MLESTYIAVHSCFRYALIYVPSQHKSSLVQGYCQVLSTIFSANTETESTVQCVYHTPQKCIHTL